MIKNDVEKNVVLNNNTNIIFNDVDFVHKQKSNFVVRKMISFIIVRNLKIIQH